MIFASITGILQWAGGRQVVRYLDNSDDAPYVLKDGLYQYFSWHDSKQAFILVATSKREV